MPTAKKIMAFTGRRNKSNRPKPMGGNTLLLLFGNRGDKIAIEHAKKIDELIRKARERNKAAQCQS